MYLTKNEIEEILDKELFIEPILDREKQINSISIDLRLGCDFLVSIQGRDAFINASKNKEDIGQVNRFFQETRRKFGETFILHPGQMVLASSLEYLKLPNNVFGVLTMRSSYSRLGLVLSSVVQPGYCGCISLELTNFNKTSLNLTIGATLFQIQFVKLNESYNYFDKRRKYMCQNRPNLSAIQQDEELFILNKIWKEDNNIS